MESIREVQLNNKLCSLKTSYCTLHLDNLFSSTVLQSSCTVFHLTNNINFQSPLNYSDRRKKCWRNHQKYTVITVGTNGRRLKTVLFQIIDCFLCGRWALPSKRKMQGVNKYSGAPNSLVD